MDPVSDLARPRRPRDRSCQAWKANPTDAACRPRMPPSDTHYPKSEHVSKAEAMQRLTTR